MWRWEEKVDDAIQSIFLAIFGRLVIALPHLISVLSTSFDRLLPLPDDVRWPLLCVCDGRCVVFLPLRLLLPRNQHDRPLLRCSLSLRSAVDLILRCLYCPPAKGQGSDPRVLKAAKHCLLAPQRTLGSPIREAPSGGHSRACVHTGNFVE